MKNMIKRELTINGLLEEMLEVAVKNEISDFLMRNPICVVNKHYHTCDMSGHYYLSVKDSWWLIKDEEMEKIEKPKYKCAMGGGVGTAMIDNVEMPLYSVWNEVY